MKIKLIVIFVLMSLLSLNLLAQDEAVEKNIEGENNPPQTTQPESNKGVQNQTPNTIQILGDSPLTLEASLRLRDPFKQPMLKSLKQDDIGNIPEIEKYPIDQFKLIGVVTGTKKNKAMLMGPNNKLHIIGEKDSIGNRKGYVKKIAKNRIIFEEKMINILGKEERTETVLEFSETEKK